MAMIAVVVLAEHHAYLLDNNVSDDAMTPMQYAKNLAPGSGLVFNLGERVEGHDPSVRRSSTVYPTAHPTRGCDYRQAPAVCLASTRLRGSRRGES